LTGGNGKRSAKKTLLRRKKTEGQAKSKVKKFAGKPDFGGGSLRRLCNEEHRNATTGPYHKQSKIVLAYTVRERGDRAKPGGKATNLFTARDLTPNQNAGKLITEINE